MLKNLSKPTLKPVEVVKSIDHAVEIQNICQHSFNKCLYIDAKRSENLEGMTVKTA